MSLVEFKNFKAIDSTVSLKSPCSKCIIRLGRRMNVDEHDIAYICCNPHWLKSRCQRRSEDARMTLLPEVNAKCRPIAGVIVPWHFNAIMMCKCGAEDGRDSK